MQGRRAVPTKSFQMVRGAVALILRQAVLGIHFVEFCHPPVAFDFREDRGRSDGDGPRVSVDQRLLLDRQVELDRVEQQVIGQRAKVGIRRRAWPGGWLDRCSTRRCGWRRFPPWPRPARARGYGRQALRGGRRSVSWSRRDRRSGAGDSGSLRQRRRGQKAIRAPLHRGQRCASNRADARRVRIVTKQSRPIGREF